MGTAATFQKERRIELLRGLTNRLAVNCHSGIYAIEEIPGWEKNPELNQWHSQLLVARDALQKQPSPKRSALMVPAVDPPAGGGGGQIGGAMAPSTAALDWHELVGQQ